MNFNAQIEQILQKRKTNLPEIESDEKCISEMQKKLKDIEHLVETSEDKEIKKSLPSIESALRKLEVALEKVRNVKKRFNRDTVNIGVSGEARVGKSTVLQQLSGLNDEQIPTGSGQPVTACRSRIFNQPQDEPAFAVIQFFTKPEFLEKRVRTLLENLPYQINSVEDFQYADFSKKFDANDERHVEKNKKLEKLRSMQSAYKYYERFLGSPDKRIDNLDELKNYVAYSDRNEERLYPAVKNVDIHCHFPLLDGVKVQLIDLPGFGEIGNVDRIQLEGLETEVDHALVVLRPAEGKFVNQQYANMSQTLQSVQKDVKDRKNLMSYALNIQKSLPNIESLTKNLKDDIIQNDKNVAENCNLYEIEAVDSASVQEMFGKILERMITALPQMDEDFLNAYKAELGFDDIKNSFKDILKIAEATSKTIPGEETEISQKAEDIRGLLNQNFSAEMEKIGEATEERLGDFIDVIKNKVNDAIRKDLMFKPYGIHTSWEEDLRLRDKHNAPENVYNDERDRLRIEILDSYEKLNEFYKQEIENLRSKIVDIFKSYTGNFVSKDVSGTEAISKIIEKLEFALPEAESLIEAFEWIKKINLDFRQNIYPFIFSSDERKEFTKPFESPKGKDGNYVDLSYDEKIAYIKSHLEVLALQLNDNIRNNVLDKDFTKEFIYCSFEHFCDLLIRADEEKTRKAFRNFVSVYKEEIMPEKFGDGKISNKELLLKLQKNIKTVLSLIEKLQNA